MCGLSSSQSRACWEVRIYHSHNPVRAPTTIRTPSCASRPSPPPVFSLGCDGYVVLLLRFFPMLLLRGCCGVAGPTGHARIFELCSRPDHCLTGRTLSPRAASLARLIPFPRVARRSQFGQPAEWPRRVHLEQHCASAGIESLEAARSPHRTAASRCPLLPTAQLPLAAPSSPPHSYLSLPHPPPSETHARRRIALDFLLSEWSRRPT